MRRLSLIGFVLFFAASIWAQQTNSWINYGLKYFKFPVYREGIYRIDSTTLASYFDLSTVNPKNFRLFFKGKEQNIFIRGESDNLFQSKDYIDFYGNPNMRDIDSLMYFQGNVNYVPSPYLPLFNDTVYAFITLAASPSVKRYTYETDTNSVAYNAASYFYTDNVFKQLNTYNSIWKYTDGLTDPHYTTGEGWGTYLAKGNVYTTNFPILSPYTASALPCYVQLNYMGASNEPGMQLDHEVKLSYTDSGLYNVDLVDTLFKSFQPFSRTYTVSSVTLDNLSQFSFASVANPSFTTFDNGTLLYHIYFKHAQTLNLDTRNKYRIITDNGATSKVFYNFQNFSFGPSDSVLLYDITNGRRIKTVKNGPFLRAVIPNGTPGQQSFCYLSSETQTIAVNNLRPAGQNGTFVNYLNTNNNNPYVIIYNRQLLSGAQQYAAYRASAAGGAFQVIMADVDQLFEQYSYGVDKHPVAIRGFMKLLMDSLAIDPKYVFLIGHGVNPSALATTSYEQYNLVPSIGVPPNDGLYTSQLSSTIANAWAPEIPIGRISALSNTEVTDYLAKVQSLEASGRAEWRKKVLHFVGGNDPGLTTQLYMFLQQDSVVIADTSFGGNVLFFKKNTTAPIQITISDSIKNCISHGCALLTFFGHGSEQGFDQAIDNPDDFDNKDKYPFIVANSCYSGDIHIPGRRSVSERFVFATQKGSAGFLAATSTGLVYALRNYTDQFYIALGRTRYNQGIGDVIKEAAIKNSIYPDSMVKFASLDMTLNGDPAVKITNGPCPDYVLNNNDVSFVQKKDSVGIKIKILNIGKAVPDSFYIKVERTFPNGDQVVVWNKARKSTLYRDSLTFFMHIDYTKGVGLNKFTVKIDALNQISECSENNNNTSGTVDYFIAGGDILPAYPYNYAIIEKTPTLTLKATTSDPFAPLTSYRLQLDTCDKFLAPIQSTLVTSRGGVIEWNVNLPFRDSTVYFWRVSRDSTSPALGFSWKESSFQTIGNKRGWGQAHFNQFKNDVYQFVSYKKDLRQFIFENTKYSVSCRNGIPPALASVSINYFFNNILMTAWGCAPGGWIFAVFDSVSGQPQVSRSALYPAPGPGTYHNILVNNCICEQAATYYNFAYGQGNYCGFGHWKENMENFLNTISPGDHVLAYTMGDSGPPNAHITEYSASLINAFKTIGAGDLSNVSDTVPIIIFGKKGMTQGQAHQVIGANKSSVILLSDTFSTKWNSGYIASDLIGPSFKWNSLHWRVKPVTQDIKPGDSTKVKVIGYKTTGQVDTLASFSEDSLDVLDLGRYADAALYPYIKLIAYMHDDTNRTSPQLKRWQVLYDEAPECALNPLKGFASINDTLMEGDVVTFKFPIENIGVKTFRDSLLVTYWIEDNSHNKVMLSQQMKKKDFAPGEVIIDTIKINSYQLTGINGLWIYVNPVGNAKYQYEQYQFNNVGRYSFKVNRDVTNPLLDVTFDGIRILNGDLVSAKPNILITLKDENKFLQLNDTSAFTVSIQAPNQPSSKRIYFSQDLEFTPANLPKNSCAINYYPNFQVDGKYSLYVTAKDRSNNKSGLNSYQVDFIVDNKPSVTNILNYPNPFNNSTRFVFTLTGSEIPEVFTIQIMTITGKVVREITRAELGHIHIGRNITEFAWDGRDEFGDRLANGVYLYRVITKLNGDNIEKSSSGADKFFTKDFGKMVIMR